VSAQIIRFQPMAELPNRIRELRIARDWSQDQLAAACNCSKAQISDLERGNRGLDLHWMRRLAKVLGVTPGELLSQDDNPLLPVGDEREIIERYRGASTEQKGDVARVVQALLPTRVETRKRKERAA
jgi:transcriptional regulator with XRE-family HTH domain